jgi:hypothetical protein
VNNPAIRLSDYFPLPHHKSLGVQQPLKHFKRSFLYIRLIFTPEPRHFIFVTSPYPLRILNGVGTEWIGSGYGVGTEWLALCLTKKIGNTKAELEFYILFTGRIDNHDCVHQTFHPRITLSFRQLLSSAKFISLS